jgi:hypothetical protein
LATASSALIFDRWSAFGQLERQPWKMGVSEHTTTLSGFWSVSFEAVHEPGSSPASTHCHSEPQAKNLAVSGEAVSNRKTGLL